MKTARRTGDWWDLPTGNIYTHPEPALPLPPFTSEDLANTAERAIRLNEQLDQIHGPQLERVFQIVGELGVGIGYPAP